MLLVSLNDLAAHWKKVGEEAFVKGLYKRMENAFRHWQHFDHYPRLAMHHGEDLFELMPSLGPDFFSFKYVNGHRHNTDKRLPTVLGLGMLADKSTGMPLMFCEMTILTAWRTAVVSALASSYMVPKLASYTLGVLGTGAQSEFQALAHYWHLPIERVVFFDIDDRAMKKFAKHMKAHGIEHEAMGDAESLFKMSDVVITSTVPQDHKAVVKAAWCRPGLHISAIGGDSPYKRELPPAVMKKARVVVEYWPQSQKEGEVKGCERTDVYAELWQLVQGKKKGRLYEEDLTVFDSVGIALEDYVTLQYVYDCMRRERMEHEAEVIPELVNPKDLYGCFSRLNQE